MTRLCNIGAALLCLLIFGTAGKAQNITNKGTDFWVAYGHHQFMEYNCNGSTPFDHNSQEMVLYISTEQAATVTVTIDQSGIGATYGPTWWRRTYNIPANTVINTGTYAAVSASGNAGLVGPMPKGGGGTYDSRLWTDAPPAGTGGEGIFSKKAIHIESNVPVTAYAHIYGSVSSGATMLLPTNAWAYSYATINSQQGDADRSYNWIYVIAKENNTRIEITPSQPSRLGKPAGVPFIVNLNKGQIYQLIGQSQCSTGNGVQLTGTKIKSIANASGQCYPIAVFSGSSRTGGEITLCGSSGRDNDMQQCFPVSTWGKRYLTSPAAKSSGSANLKPSQFQTHVYKILVKDPTTVVRVNGSTAIPGALINNSYYQYRSGTADYIEADKPIMVGMFFSSGSNCGSVGGGTDGDPEMLYLSPIEQAIKQVGLFRNNLEAIYSNWVNIVLPDNGLNSLVIDGIAWASIPAAQKHSYPMTNKPGYTVAVRGWPSTQTQIKIQSDSAFNAFTYGLGGAESYGFNAGCFLNNLSAVSSVRNTPDTTTSIKSHPHTFVSTPTQISALITYKPTKIIWKFSAMNPSGFVSPVPSPDPVVNNPVPYDSVLVGAAWQYYYLCPGGPFTFSKEGTYYLPVRLTSPDPEVGDCNNEEEMSLQILVKQKPFANFTRNIRGCGRDTVTFTGPATTSNGYTVKTWDWLLSNGLTSKSKDTAFVLDPGTYTMKLTITVEHGGIADTTISFTIHPKPTIDFNINPNPACPGPVTFSTTASYPGTPGINNWYWDLASAGIVNANSAANQVKTYAIGTYTIRHAVSINQYCKSDTVTKTLTVQAGAMVDFTYPTDCVPTTGVAQFTSNSTNQPGVSYQWTFGDPGSGANNTSTAQNPTHTYANNGTYSVRLQISTPGCNGDTTFQVVINKRAVLAFPGPLAAVCRNAAPVNIAVATHDTASGTGYYYDASGATTSAGMFNPATAGIGTHTIWYVFTTTGGCKDSVSQTITVNNGAPKPSVSTPIPYCQNGAASPLTATALGGHTLNWYDNPGLTNGSTTAPVPSTATAGTFYYYVTQTPPSGCEGDSATIAVVITPSITGHTVLGPDQTLCIGTPATPVGPVSTIAGGAGSGTYTFQWQQSTNNGVSWSDIPTATNITYDPGSLTQTTWFRLKVASGLCAGTSDPAKITIATPPVNTITADQIICAGSPVAGIDGSTAPSGAVYGWEFSTDGGSTWNTVAGVTTEDYQPTNVTLTTKFRRTLVYGPCASFSNEVLITVNPVANGNISAASNICQYNNGKVQFTATAGTAPFTVFLTVTNPAGVSAPPQQAIVSSGDSILVIPVNSAPGSYIIKLDSIRNSNGCITTGLNSITIDVTATPTVIITPAPSNIVCEGTSVTLTASGASTYLWDGSSVANPLTVTPNATTTYNVIGSTNGCSSSQESVIITVNPKPAKPAVTIPGPYCQNATSAAVSATADAGNTLTWFTNNNLTGGSAAAPVPSTSVAGTFYFYVNQTTAANCTGDTSTITVTVQPSIANNNISASHTICEGTSATTLTAAGNPTGGDGNYTYSWERFPTGGSGWAVIPGVTSDSYNPGNLSVTTQFRRVVASGQCSNTSNFITVTVVPAITGNAILSTDQVICEGSPAAIINGSTVNGVSYSWLSSTDGGATWTAIPTATTEDFQPTGLATTTRFRRVAVNGPCTDTSNFVQITVNPLADGNISAVSNICEYDYAKVRFNATAGTATFTVYLSITDPSGVTTDQQSSVANGDSILVIPVGSAPGSYTIKLDSIRNSNGCVRSTGLNTLTINVTATPALAITLNPGNAICDGKSVVLSVAGANTYSWTGTALSSTTGNSVTATPTTPNTYNYSVIGTTNGCSSSKDTVITVNPTPGKPIVATPDTYCQLGPANPLQATANGTNTLKWYDNPALTGGGVTAAPTPSTTNAGNIYYYVTQTNSFGCESDTAITTIIVNPGISGNDIIGGETICQGSAPTTPLTGTGSLTGGNGTYVYQWQQSTDGGNTWTNISGATNTNYTPGTLNVTTQFRRLVSSSQCGSASNVITETVLIGLANYDISASQTVCEGGPVGMLDGQTATGSGTLVYTWQSSLDGTTWSDIPSTDIEDYQPPALSVTTYYRRKVTNGPCTGFSSAVQIVVKPLANGTIAASSAAICEYETADVTFTSTAGTAPFNLMLSITNPAGVTSTQPVNSANSGTTANVIPLNSAPGNYTIALSSITSNGCTRSSGLNSVTIAVKPTPTVGVNPIAPICATDSATLTATGATTYTWTPATALSSVTGNPVKAAPSTTTTYTVVGTTNGCSAQSTATVTVNPRPTVNINVADNEICITDIGSFTASSSISSGSVQTYYWDFDNGNTQVNPGTISTTNPQSYSTHRTYITRLYAVSDQGCNSVTDTAHIHVNPLPVAAFQPPPFVCLPNNVATFQNQSSIPNGAPLNYTWNFGDPASGAANTSTATNGTHVYPDSANYIITLNVVSAQGCTAQTTNTFNAFFRKPVAKFGVTPDTLCQGIQNLFLDSSFAPGSSIKNRLWLFGDGNSLLDSTNAAKIYTRPGDYKVALVVSNDQGCTSDTAYKNIKVYLQPVIDAGPSYTIAAGTTVTFNANANSGSLQFAWSSPTGATVSDPSILKPQYFATQDAKFILTATGQGNCKAWDSITVKVLFPIVIPNAFSPNGDGVNDKWEITNLRDYPNCAVEVYNRYGQVVYRSFGGYQSAWDGTHNGNPLPVGTYYYIIEPKNGFPRATGFVVIVR
jgi:gliding motility-associated-like protein